jgi:c-di-GMP-binding flagellar brake protein YcgR
MAERRKYIRLDSSINVDYRVIGRQHVEDKTLCKNISAGGVRIHLKERVPAHTQLDIKFVLPNDSKQISVVGEVVWQTDKDAKGDFDTGIKYVQIDSFDMQKITDYVLRCLGKKLSEAQDKITVGKKTISFLFKEIRLPGDQSPALSAPDALINEINLPGDKVRYAKISSRLGIKYKCITGNREEGRSFSQYISSKGVWFLSDKNIALGNVIGMTIELTDERNPIIVTGEVVSAQAQTRYDDTQVKIYYEIGVKFTVIPPQERKRVIRHVYNCKTDYMMIGKVPPPGWLRFEG